MNWQSVLKEKGKIDFRIGRAGDELVAEWCGRATLHAHRTTGRSHLDFEDDVDPKWRRKLEHGMVRAMLRQLRGGLTLHASSLALADCGILLLGPSGAGKSTLAAVLAQRTQLNLLSDDTSPITFENGLAYTSTGDPELWLLADARAAIGSAENRPGKVPIDVASVTMEKVRIGAIVVLAYGEVDVPVIRPMRGHAALVPLLAGTVRLVVDEHEVQLREIAQLESLSRATKLFELVRPRNLDRISESADVIARLLEENRK